MYVVISRFILVDLGSFKPIQWQTFLDEILHYTSSAPIAFQKLSFSFELTQLYIHKSRPNHQHSTCFLSMNQYPGPVRHTSCKPVTAYIRLKSNRHCSKQYLLYNVVFSVSSKRTWTSKLHGSIGPSVGSTAPPTTAACIRREQYARNIVYTVRNGRQQ